VSRVIAVIPARYGASRLPAKPLADIAGKPMIQWVYNRVREAGLDPKNIYIATDDGRIRDAAQKFGAQVVMTSPECKSGSDRIAQAVASIECEFVLNIQGDEPLLPPAFIRALAQGTRTGEAQICTVVAPIIDAADYTDPNVVKVALNSREEALYFSRSPLPYFRDTAGRWPGAEQPVYRHFGLYGYRKEYLLEFARRPPSFLEESERLEQLRALEHGDTIRCLIESGTSIGVDTPEDLERVRAIVKSQN
jgi:3-deoxy-manno-octulosonate cytidylyltransferase (CMP-KDO synthetase)